MNQETGVIVAVNVSREKGTRKVPVERALLRVGHGVEGDAHAGAWHRQVSLLSMSSIEKMRGKGLELQPGDFAENLTVSGLDVWALPVGTRLLVGDDVELEVTQIGKECHLGCDIRRQVGDCVMPREGIFAKVVAGGVVRPGDAVRVRAEVLA
jgi:MOSC domain-containing protein YiiM